MPHIRSNSLVNLIADQAIRTSPLQVGFNATASARNRNQQVFDAFLDNLTSDESKKLPLAKSLGLPTSGLIVGGQRDVVLSRDLPEDRREKLYDFEYEYKPSEYLTNITRKIIAGAGKKGKGGQ